MVIFSDIYCQVCDRFITKEQWDEHLFSKRHLHKEFNRYWPSNFPQTKLTRDEGSKLEKAFLEIKMFCHCIGFCKHILGWLQI